ncbi:flagellar biosynthetic protein FliQ [Roseomonas sp. GC11]|uniref:flagellar biosynthetic protein FliQ n=1 Tax=Roseomonas sp. GC11 TaxID=2950546 RepID=UPI002109BB92|nr:flagellar biosynthetic protein FliQ [Roseomonas sp. GC11]MCQ4161970.1 flagellar biosynthetic protein FliQ [Roseomonas sp. GC11]
MMDAELVGLAGQQALWTALLIGGPLLGVLLAVGLAVALFQALTQVQEAALAFVPKLLALGLMLLFGSSAAVTALRSLTERLFDQVVALGGLR